jgi:hypothetical protein
MTQEAPAASEEPIHRATRSAQAAADVDERNPFRGFLSGPECFLFCRRLELSGS